MRGTRGLFHLCVLLAVAAIAVACAGASPTAAPTAVPTTAPTAAPTQAPTVPPTAAITPAPPTPEPATPKPPTPEPATPQPATPEATEGGGPADLLISYVHPDLQATCEVRAPVYDTEVVGIVCGPEDLPVDFTLFGSFADMAAAYNRDLTRGETPPQPDGTCPEANYEGPYGTDETPLGRLNCRGHTSSAGDPYRVLEWTNDELLVIGYISNREDLHTWEELIAFRAASAGPYPPD